ncbi:hypothetical protein QZH41_004833 [Actinostola sp. cb2023]|nr:hypothetical protein QZH41_004833 [Actinostola sp. cb2023]
MNPKNSKSYQVDFTIVQGDYTPLLGLQTATQMKLLKVYSENILLVSQDNSIIQTKESCLKDFADVFDHNELGCMSGKVHLETDPNVTPNVMPPRRVPVAVKGKLKAELDRLTKRKVISPVEEPTDWVSSMIAVMKPNGTVRLCIDPQHLNQALKRCHYPLPIIEELLPELTKARVFSKADLKEGFLQVQLDEESSKLTTFQTPWGRYRWHRLPFGIAPAPEIFQIKLDQNLEGLKGTFAIADDILITGQGDTDNQANEDHDKNLQSFLHRCRERNIKLNKDKFDFKCEEVCFIGHRLTKEGLKLDPNKVNAIMNMMRPEDVPAVQRLIGMKDYLCTVDYYSGYFEVDKLERKTAKSIVKRLKRHFSNHGIPNELFSDNGPPFDSHEFREFANDYEFTLTTSSPNYPQSNGRVENAVKTAKRLMKKTKEAGTDFYLALLDWRNTPTEGVNSSPAQRLYGRRTRTLLPTSATLLKPKIPHNVRDKLLVKKELQTKYYNRHTRELPPLTPGDQVRVIPKPNDRSTKWTKAEVEEQVDVRSYNIRTEDGRVYRRNRRHLRKSPPTTFTYQQSDYLTHTAPTSKVPPSPVIDPPLMEASDVPTRPTPTTAPLVPKPLHDEISPTTRTRSGREVKPPSHLKDYVLSKQPMGIHKINDMMKSIIIGTSFESSTKNLTNHSARKTVVKKMKTAGLERSSIMKVTGHRNISSLDDYDEADENEQRQLSTAISGTKNNITFSN